MATRKPTAQPCVITVGFQQMLMPAEQGMAMLKLLQHAVTCEQSIGDWPPRYRVGDQPRVEFELVKPSQIDMPQNETEARRRTRATPLLEG